MKRSELFFTALLLPVDWLMVVAAFLAAYHSRLNVGDVDFFWPLEQYMPFVLVVSSLWMIIFALAGMYSPKRLVKRWDHLSSTVVGVAGGTMLVVAWPFLTRQEFFSRLVVIYLFVFAALFVTIGRWLVGSIQQSLYRYGVGIHRVLIVGVNQVARELVAKIADDKRLGMRLVGLLTTETAEAGELSEKVLGAASNIERLVAKDQVDEIIVADSNAPKELLLKLISYAEERGITLKISPTLLEVYSSRILATDLAGLPILEYRRTPLDGWGRILKRVFDIIVSGILIIIFSPLMLLIALLILLDSGLPIFFNRLDDGSPAMRVGQFGRFFHYFKFRSMKPNTHNLRYTELADQNVREGPLVKIPNDPRITRVGRILRKLSLDELPEFFLVFLGRMSLVGPRPHLPEEVARYQSNQRRVLMIKPGITGMAQISGRSELNFDEEVRLDTYYIENWSLWLDLKILLQTPLAVLRSRKRRAS